MRSRNKHGQTMGRKGIESRRRLLDAARDLIERHASHEVTVSAIARTAGLASQTFYIYFENVTEVFLALSREAAEDLHQVHEVLAESPFITDAHAFSERFVEAYSAYWDRNRPTLRLRNYLADSGAADFITERQVSSYTIIKALADRMRSAQAENGLGERAAFARGVVLFAAIERLAGRPPTLRQELPLSVVETSLKQAEIDILTQLFTPPEHPQDRISRPRRAANTVTAARPSRAATTRKAPPNPSMPDRGENNSG